MKKLLLTWNDIRSRAETIAREIRHSHAEPISIYGIPRGGIFAALAIQEAARCYPGPRISLVSTRDEANVYIDDLVDSGKTKDQHADKPFYALLNKQKEDLDGVWIEFPWETMANETGPTDAVTRLLQYIGDDPEREGLLKTPERVIRSYGQLFGGYQQRPEEVLTVFEEDSCDEMVVLKDVEFFSTCEHHMLPFYGKVHIAYVPDGRIVGVSKLARVLEIYSRRLQVQERLTQQVADAIMVGLKPLGAACVIEAKHLCMVARGVQKQNSVMVTSSLKGVFLDKPEVRAEFLGLVRE